MIMGLTKLNNRVPNLPQNQLVSQLVSIEANLNELRTSQRVSAVGGMLNYRTQTSNTWDLNETIGAPSDGVARVVTITVQFTGDGTQQYPTQSPLFDLFINSPIEANRLSANNDVYNSSPYLIILQKFPAAPDPLNANVAEAYIPSVAGYWPDPLVWQWVVQISFNTGGASYYFKASTVGTSSGTVSVSRVIT